MSHGITCAVPPCPFWHSKGECRHNPPRVLAQRYDRGDAIFPTWPPVDGSTDWCGKHPALTALVRRGGEVLDDDNGQ